MNNNDKKDFDELNLSESWEGEVDSLKWYQHLNFFGLLRLIFGYVRNSAGRKDNMLLMVYIMVGLNIVAFYWGSRPVIRHDLRMICSGSSKVKKTSRVRNGMIGPMKCQGATVNVNITGTKPGNLPSAYYYSLVLLTVALLISYFGRRRETREWIVNLFSAWKGGRSTYSLPKDEGDEGAKGSVSSSVKENKFSGHEPLPNIKE